VNSKAVLGLTAGALALGLLAGLILGGNGETTRATQGAGPSKAVAGVAVGFAHSRAGAVAAAVAYATALSEATSWSPDERRAAIAAMSSEAGRGDVQRSADNAYAVIDKPAPPDGSLFVRSGTLAFRLARYDDSQAQVILWSVDVAGAQSTAAQAGWTTKTVLLGWEDNDWKLAGFPDATEGPTPALQGQPTPVESLVSSLKGMEPLSNGTTN
jgi:hypothetical protein